MTEISRFTIPTTRGEAIPTHPEIIIESQRLADLSLELKGVVQNRTRPMTFDSSCLADGERISTDRYRVWVTNEITGSFARQTLMHAICRYEGVCRLVGVEPLDLEKRLLIDFAHILFAPLKEVFENVLQDGLQNLTLVQPDFAEIYYRRLFEGGGQFLIKL